MTDQTTNTQAPQDKSNALPATPPSTSGPLKSNAEPTKENAAEPEKFGTFLGVFTPSLLTILGMMMYLRFGWVLGNAGLVLTLAIVLMASVITFITSLSASAIATNMRVGVGGVYYMVSRSLGPSLGGAIGIPLFMCQTLSLTLYAFGLAESIGFLWPAERFGEFPLLPTVATIIVLITAISGKSASLALKLQIPVMVLVGASLLALFGGVFSGEMTAPELGGNFARSAPEGFWYVFAVFFPAVTGFTVGINMSGDLKDPVRSIPVGSILAVLCGTVIYLAIPFVLSMTTKVTPAELAVLDPTAPPVWTKVAWFGFWLVYPGMWGAILSSAFGSALGAPRVLQALAIDRMAPRLFARTSATGQPRYATALTGLFALAAVALGNLNTVGVWVTIFFLTLYVTINFTAAIEALVRDPSYRPTIVVPWYISFLGGLGTLAVMFLINPLACVSAIVFEVCLYIYLRRRSMRQRWGDVRIGIWMTLARYVLLQLRDLTMHTRNWRPHILLLSDNPGGYMNMVRMADWFNQKRGIMTVCHLYDQQSEITSISQLHERILEMEKTLFENDVLAFCRAHIVRNFEDGVLTVAQANGLSSLRTNMVMLGWPRPEYSKDGSDKPSLEPLENALHLMKKLSRLGKSTIMAKMSPEGMADKKSIDVWCRGKLHNGDIMLLLAHLLRLNAPWRAATITLRTIIEDPAEGDRMEQRLLDMVDEARIPANVEVIARTGDFSVAETMHAASYNADVVFMGLSEPEDEDIPAYAIGLNELLKGFRSVMMVRNGDPFEGQLL